VPIPSILVALVALQVAAATRADPFAFFQPSVTLGTEERDRLDEGKPVARTLPGADREISMFAAVAVDIDGDRLVAWMREIAALKKSSYVLAIGRFSDPPTLDDLADLRLDDGELSKIRRCRPGDCDVKLSGTEMRQLRRAADEGGDAWKERVQEGFREVVLQRVRAYLDGGHGALPPSEDHSRAVDPGSSFARLIARSVFLTRNVPEFADHLSGYPASPLPGVESFVYWSKERLANKPTISVTHVNILRGRPPNTPDALVASKQIFATHYFNASLALTAIVGDQSGSRYLAYLNRSEVDALGGPFGGLVRWVAQRRLRGEAMRVLENLRVRLESGDPPASGG
jgi:hypothetical protein